MKFQEKCVRYLLDESLGPGSGRTIVVKAPTGSGKTVILIAYMDAYLTAKPRTAFIWLCPGKGELEEQSRRRMQQICPNRGTRTLADALNGGFEAGTVTFINWEMVTKKDNHALKDTEHRNLFERIAQAGREGISFVAVIDEEHSNKTAKADLIIRALNPSRLIRMSATATETRRQVYYEVEEQEVIDEGLITRAVCVNEGVRDGAAEIREAGGRGLPSGAPAELPSGAPADLPDAVLIELADRKRRQIAEAYQQLGINVRPLVLIQFPSGQPERVAEVESQLAAMGCTYENGLAAKWMASDKRALSRDIADNAGKPVFLLMKQAVSTGWDCPRAKILVKLREGGSETFQIQTVGRIRRMPEGRHYGVDLLDQCYVYTLDREYKAGLLSAVDRAYEAGLQAMEEAKKADTRPPVSQRALFNAAWRYYTQERGFTTDMERNRGVFMREADSGGGSAPPDYSSLTRIAGELETALEPKTGTVDSAVIKAVLERLFRDRGDRTKKLLALETEEFYGFIIQNQSSLVQDFRRIADRISGEGTTVS